MSRVRRNDSCLESRSITGHELIGDKQLRFAYLDEAGISRSDQDPYIVYAAVVVEPDRHLKAIATSIREIADNCFPDRRLYDLGRQFNFHAKDIFHGSGDFPRSEWPQKKRLELLETLVNLLRSNKIPVVVGYVKQSSVREEVENYDRYFERKRTAKQIASSIRKNGIQTAYFRCVRSLEFWMRQNAREEVISLIVENNPEYSQDLGEFHLMITSPPDRDPVIQSSNLFISNHIVEALHFVEKHQSPLVQLADIAAFVCKRQLQRCTKIRPIFDQMRPCLELRMADESGLSMDREASIVMLPDFMDNKRAESPLWYKSTRVAAEKTEREAKNSQEEFSRIQKRRKSAAKKARKKAKSNYGLPD